jgi:hypothetical protein
MLTDPVSSMFINIISLGLKVKQEYVNEFGLLEFRESPEDPLQSACQDLIQGASGISNQ